MIYQNGKYMENMFRSCNKYVKEVLKLARNQGNEKAIALVFYLGKDEKPLDKEWFRTTSDKDIVIERKVYSSTARVVLKKYTSSDLTTLQDFPLLCRCGGQYLSVGRHF